MGELKREIENVKRQCRNDPDTRAFWRGILIMLGVGLIVFIAMMRYVF